MQPMQQNDNVWNGRDDASFEDSERFEEDSVSIDESIDGNSQNWRGWVDCPSNGEAIQPGVSCLVYQYHNASGRFSSASSRTLTLGEPSNSARQPSRCDMDGEVPTLADVSSKVCAEKWSFQQLEEMYTHICNERKKTGLAIVPPTTAIPEKIFLSFIVHCFPQSTDELRLYSTLANGSAEQFEFGKALYEWGHVSDVSQTGFLLSGNVRNSNQLLDARNVQAQDHGVYHVTVKVDRCQIIECTCECPNKSNWCKHVVALCIYRVKQRYKIQFNETIADAINSMSELQLRRLLQWHISEIPTKCIPGFQRLINEIKDPASDINRIDGAPDPTDGGHDPISRFEFPEIEHKIRRLLCRYCIPSPSVHCDVSHLSSTNHPPIHIEWNAMMKPYRCREPEGMWNLLQMVREMFARNDANAVALLRTVTDECLSNSQILLWWYITKLVESGNWTIINAFKMPNPQPVLSQLNCSLLLDEVVVLWKLVAMNPRAGKEYRGQLAAYLVDYHRTTVNRLKTMINMTPSSGESSSPKTDATIISNHQTANFLETICNVDTQEVLSAANMNFTLSCFPAFYEAIKMCHYLNDQDIQLTSSEDAIFYCTTFQQNLCGYKLVPPTKEKVLKNKKKKKKLQKRAEEARRRGGNQMDEFQGVDGMWRMLPDEQADNAAQNDSVESGQESDVQKPHSSSHKHKKHVVDSLEMEVDEVLAAAFTPLDPLETRFLRVEAYGTHGFRSDAIDYSLKVVDYLIDSLTDQSNIFSQKLEVASNQANMPSTSSKPPLSSSSSASSEDLVGEDRKEEVDRSNKFLTTMQKILYVTKVLKDSPDLQRTVFDISMRTLSVTKWPFFTRHQQVLAAYLEAEFVAILDQLWQNVPLGELQMEQIRNKAQELAVSDQGGNGELPALSLSKFLFLALYWTESTAQPPRNPGAVLNAVVVTSAALQHNRQMLISSDSDLALHCALNVLGCRPTLSDRYILHWETIRKEKNELTCILLSRHKDSQEKCALIIDRALDPKMHRMYQHHYSNAAYFLERCPEYIRRFKVGQRPVFPYVEEVEPEEVDEEEEAAEEAEEEPDPIADYEAQLLQLQRMAIVEPLIEAAGPLFRGRTSDEGMQSSSSSDISSCSNRTSDEPSTSRSADSFNTSTRRMPGITRENMATMNAMRKDLELPGSSNRAKKRAVQSLPLDPRNFVTESHVFHTFELAKKVLFEAGGQSNTVIWGQPNAVHVNRRLHLCAIVIAVYALGMSNRISPCWNTRTYSYIAGWVTSQVQEVGSQSIEIIREIWMAHFTPSEVASISEKSSPITDPNMKHETAKLALSVLPFAHALSDEDVINAMRKCREENKSMLISGLMAMDTPQFREIGRTRTLFAVMQHWNDISLEEEAARNQPPPAGMVQNPYMNLHLVHLMNQGQAQQRRQPRQQPRRQQQQQHRVVLPQQMPIAHPLVLPQAAFLYPQAYRNDIARLHQSQSAPQLVGTQVDPGSDQSNIPVQPVQMTNHQLVPPPNPATAIVNAYNYGMRAMDCMATSPGEERQMYRKFGPHPPYSEDLQTLYNVSKQLGGQHLFQFYSNASRSVISPYILHQYARDSINCFTRHYNPNLQMTMVTGYSPPQQMYSPVNVRYPNVRFSAPGQITNIFISQGFNRISGELFERCCEQYLQAIVNKLNSPRANDNVEFLNQLNNFIQSAFDAFQCIPNMGLSLFEDFVRTFKRQKAFRKEHAQAINQLLSQLLN